MQKGDSEVVKKKGGKKRKSTKAKKANKIK